MLRLAILLTVACIVNGATYNGRYKNSKSKSASKACELDVRLDVAGKNPPVLLVENEKGELQLAGPTSRSKYSSYMNLKNQNILVTCPGNGNSLTLGNRAVSEASATCSSNGTSNVFIIDGQEYKPDSLKCSKRVTPYEYNTGESCMGDGTLLKLGYMIKNKIHELITTCHRVVDGKTYYSQHILDGSHLPQKGNGGKRQDEEGRPTFSFQNKILFKGFPPYKYYKQSVQLSALSNAIGNTAASEIFNEKEDRFFSKGHLSPNADFLPETWRDVTFLFVNAQPQWQEINGGNWNEVEIATRYNAAATGRKYEVITGTSGNLAPDSKNVYLDTSNSRLPVPNQYTKLIRDVESNECIALVSTNYPQDTDPVPKCNDICTAYKWPSLEQAKKAGYVYCCSYSEFAAAFPNAAPKVDCSGGILTNANV